MRQEEMQLETVRDVYRGQQLTAVDFVAGAASLPSTLTGTQRIVTVPLDTAHGLIGHVEAGDRVDVYAGFNITPVGTVTSGVQAFPVVRRLMENILVVEDCPRTFMPHSAVKRHRHSATRDHRGEADWGPLKRIRKDSRAPGDS